ncbi:MAG: hypothetical protein MZV70_20175 [Desulfobacterales bacterium]|nr:hypothetical protein [Desulfobacterales bacterium]
MRADRIQRDRGGTRFRADAAGRNRRRSTSTPIGRFMVHNALAAAAVGHAAGAFGVAEIRQRAWRRFDPVAGRMQRDAVWPTESTLIDDTYNANPASMEAALAALDSAARRRPAASLVLGDMRELGAAARPHCTGRSAGSPAAAGVGQALRLRGPGRRDRRRRPPAAAWPPPTSSSAHGPTSGAPCSRCSRPATGSWSRARAPWAWNVSSGRSRTGPPGNARGVTDALPSALSAAHAVFGPERVPLHHVPDDLCQPHGLVHLLPPRPVGDRAARRGCRSGSTSATTGPKSHLEQGRHPDHGRALILVARSPFPPCSGATSPTRSSGSRCWCCSASAPSGSSTTT